MFAYECLEDGRVCILGYKCERYGNMHLESLAQHGNVSGTELAVQVGECLVYLEYCMCSTTSC